MVEGELEVRGTAPGFLLFGLSWQHLWWRHSTGRQKLIPSGARSPAVRCLDCGLVAFQPYRYVGP